MKKDPSFVCCVDLGALCENRAPAVVFDRTAFLFTKQSHFVCGESTRYAEKRSVQSTEIKRL